MGRRVRGNAAAAIPSPKCVGHPEWPQVPLLWWLAQVYACDSDEDTKIAIDSFTAICKKKSQGLVPGVLFVPSLSSPSSVPRIVPW